MRPVAEKSKPQRNKPSCPWLHQTGFKK